MPGRDTSIDVEPPRDAVRGTRGRGDFRGESGRGSIIRPNIAMGRLGELENAGGHWPSVRPGELGLGRPGHDEASPLKETKGDQLD